ncbi:hypothetical protein BHQ15_00130 [Mycolicibacillus koreensis]|nr:hypothetical protein BHQ15_00130 [Mycolicibacillus koreensis]
MRFAATLLLWLIATAALAVAVPAGWAQRHLVAADGYADLARRAATDPSLQEAVAAQLSTQAMVLITEHGGRVDSALVEGVAAGYTGGPQFPAQFAHLNTEAHRWAFTDTADDGEFTVDLAPMLNDAGFRQILDHYDVTVPDTVTVPVTAVPAEAQWLRAGRLHPLGLWGPVVSLGAALLAAAGALGALAVARRRGKTLAALGVSALLVGAAGWAGIEVGRRFTATALNATTGDVRRIADVLLDTAVAGLHQWLNLTLAAGGALVIIGVFTAILGGMRHRG